MSVICVATLTNPIVSKFWIVDVRPPCLDWLQTAAPMKTLFACVAVVPSVCAYTDWPLRDHRHNRWQIFSTEWTVCHINGCIKSVLWITRFDTPCWRGLLITISPCVWHHQKHSLMLLNSLTTTRSHPTQIRLKVIIIFFIAHVFLQRSFYTSVLLQLFGIP